jgi:hypothetical protein
MFKQDLKSLLLNKKQEHLIFFFILLKYKQEWIFEFTDEEMVLINNKTNSNKIKKSLWVSKFQSSAFQDNSLWYLKRSYNI